MWVCLCKGVTDRQIRAAISAGARDVCEIGVRCRAGTGCGGCVPEVCRLLQDHFAREAYNASVAAAAALDETVVELEETVVLEVTLA